VRRAGEIESTDLPVAGRRKRLTEFLQDLIDTLRRGGIAPAVEPVKGPASVSPELELRERELVRRYLIEQIEQGRLAATPSETVIVAEWVAAVNGRRLDEQGRGLRALLDTIPESAALISPEGRLLYCNLRAAEHLRAALGLPKDELVGKTAAEIGIPAHLMIGRPIDEITELARKRERFEMNAWGREKEGQFEAIYRPNGTLGAISVIIRDIHNRRLADTRLDLLTKLSAVAGILDFDEVARALVAVPIPQFADWCALNVVRHGHIRRTYLANRDPAQAALREALQRELPAWDRHPLWQELLTSGFQLLTEVSDDMLQRLTSSSAQYRLLSHLGIISLIVVPLVSRGQITGILTFVYTKESGRRYGRDDPPLAEELALHAANTFENAQLMKDLKSSEERFRIALAGARTIVYEQDPALRYVWYYNPLVPVNMLGKTHEEVLPPDEAAVLTALKRRVLEDGEGVEQEMDFTLGGDQMRHFRETIEPLRSSTGKIVGVIGAATDITAQQRTQQQLTEELDFRERVMGILGHDLRNPLGTVILAADMTLRNPEVPASARNHLTRLRRAATRMQEMIDTLLDFTRARFMGRVPVSRVPADLAEVSRGAIEEIRTSCPDYAIELEVRGDARGEWDPARMSQTISNLVTNAIAYGSSGSTVQVAVVGNGHDVDLKVHNEGPAIAAEQLPMLFEPFRRGVPEDRSPGGLGLGLYIVKQIVQAHDGSIGVESSEQAGTTFTLHLPREPIAPAAAAPA